MHTYHDEEGELSSLVYLYIGEFYSAGMEEFYDKIIDTLQKGLDARRKGERLLKSSGLDIYHTEEGIIMKQILYDMGPLSLVRWLLQRALKFGPTFGSRSKLKRAGVYILSSILISFHDKFNPKLVRFNIFFGGGSIITKHFYCRFVSQYLQNRLKYSSSCS